MKSFLIFLFSVIITFCAGAQVTISDEIARYYLEEHERVKVYKQIVTDKDKEISILDAKNTKLLGIIDTYKADSALYEERITIEKDRADFNEELFTKEKKEKRKMRRQRNMAIGGGVGALCGSFIGPEGTIIGAAAGAGIGFVVSLFKKNDD